MLKLVVLCCVVAAVVARAPIYFAPAIIPSPLSIGYTSQALHNYRGPLSLAPGQFANILAADGRPLDTLDVNLDRSAHFVANIVDNGSRVLKKRSVTRLAVAPGPVGFSAAVASGNIGIATPVAVSSTGVAATIATTPIGLTTPFTAGSFSITSPFAAGPIDHFAPIAANPLAVSTTANTGSFAVSTPVATNPIGSSAFGNPFLRNF